MVASAILGSEGRPWTFEGMCRACSFRVGASCCFQRTGKGHTSPCPSKKSYNGTQNAQVQENWQFYHHASTSMSRSRRRRGATPAFHHSCSVACSERDRRHGRVFRAWGVGVSISSSDSRPDGLHLSLCLYWARGLAAFVLPTADCSFQTSPLNATSSDLGPKPALSTLTPSIQYR